MEKQKKTLLKNFDYLLLFLTLTCTIFGCIVISSAVKSYSDGSKYTIIQSLAAVMGYILLAIICIINYEKYTHYTAMIYSMCLIAVLVFGTGREDTGSKSWIRFGSIGIQPSEIVKIGFIITFSKMCAKYQEEINKPKRLIVLIIHAGVIMGLIMLQPDF